MSGLMRFCSFGNSKNFEGLTLLRYLNHEGVDTELVTENH
jgi:hypothetical protein